MNRRGLLIAGAVIYALILFALMTLWRLPAERCLGYLAQRLSNGSMAVRAGSVAPSLPLGYMFHDVDYSISQGDATAKGRIKTLILRFDLVNLFTAYLPITFHARMPSGGELQGKAGISMLSGLQRGFLSMKASKVKLEELGVGSLLHRNIRGTLNGEADVTGNLLDPSGLSGVGRFVLQKGSVDTRMELADLKAVPFENIRLSFVIKDGVLTMEKAEMDGPMISGTVLGRVLLNRPVERSTLDLNARLKPGSLLEKNSLAGPLLARIRKGGDDIVLRLGGALGKPTMTWNGN